MKVTRALSILLAMVLVLSLAGCKPSDPKPETPEAKPSATSLSPSASEKPEKPKESETPAVPLAEESDDEIMQQLLTTIDRNLDAIRPDLEGLFDVYVEAEGKETLAIYFVLQDESIANEESCEYVAEGTAYIFASIPPVMRDTMNMKDPRIILKFTDLDSNLVYSREFTVDDADEYAVTPTYDPDAANGEASDALLEFVNSMQSSIPDIEDSMEGLATVSIEARGTGTVAFVFHILDSATAAGLTESVIKDEALPMFETQFASIVSMMATMGIPNPSVTIEFLNPDGSVCASTDIH